MERFIHGEQTIGQGVKICKIILEKPLAQAIVGTIGAIGFLFTSNIFLLPSQADQQIFLFL